MNNGIEILEPSAAPVYAVSMYDRISDPMAAIERMGEIFSSSGMFGCTKKEQGAILALACFAERKTPFEIMRTFHLIDGKLSMRADAMLAGYMAAGGKVKWLAFSNTEARAAWTVDGVTTELSFTEADAKRAGMLPAKPGSGWTKTPDAMLRARLISKAVRMLTPGVVAGTYTPDEVEHFSTTPPALPMPVKAKIVEPENVTPVVEGTQPTLADLRQNVATRLLSAALPVEVALQFLRSKKWLKADESLADLPEFRCNAILLKFDNFVEAVQKFMPVPVVQNLEADAPVDAAAPWVKSE